MIGYNDGMDKIKVRVNAKINLTLDVLGVYGEGYHELDTVMASIDIYDVVECSRSEVISVVMDGNNQYEGNTAYKAWAICQREYGIGGLDIVITKGIPFSAGLGGSSADASAVLYCIGKIYGLSDEQLYAVARVVGSDVSFMLKGGIMRCGGKGDDLTTLPFHDYALVVAKDKSGTNTGEVFRRHDQVGQVTCHTRDYVDGIDNKGDRLSAIGNGLQHAGVVCNQEVAMLVSVLNDYSSVVSMSGSGASVYAVLPNENCANQVAGEIKNRFSFVKACNVLNYGIKELL